jgi:ABC-type branched-subunit amino acid transport system substrate-binding protein
MVLVFVMAACARSSVPPRSSANQQADSGAVMPATAEPDAPIAIRPEDSAASDDASLAAEPAAGAATALPNVEDPEATRAAEVELDLAALDTDPGATTDIASRTVRVGLLVPLSGRYAPEGETLLRGAQLALFDVADERFSLFPRDTRGTASGAAEAALSLLDEGVDLIIGPLFADSVGAVASHARSRGVNVVAFSTDRAVAGEGVYLLGHTPRAQIRRVVAHAAAQGHQRIALLAPNTRYGEAVADELSAVASSLGLSLTRVRFYASDAADAADVVRDLADYDRRAQALKSEKQALAGRDDDVSRRTLARLDKLDTLGDVPFDALLLPDGGARLRQVVPLLPYYDIDPAKVRLLGTGLWDDADTLREPTLVGSWFAGPEPVARSDFERRYNDVFGQPPGAIATLAYDATALAAALARAGVGFGPRAINDRRGFLGVDGIFRFDIEGMAERGLAVFEIKGRGETGVVSPAPDRFDIVTSETVSENGSQ